MSSSIEASASDNGRGTNQAAPSCALAPEIQARAPLMISTLVAETPALEPHEQNPTSLNDEHQTRRITGGCCDCTVCAALPFEPLGIEQGFVHVVDDGGMFDIIRQMNGLERRLDEIPEGAAKDIVDCSTQQLDKLKKDLQESGVQQQTVASFHPKEVILGKILGNGAFNSVLEVSGFSLKGTSDRYRKEVCTKQRKAKSSVYAVKRLRSSLVDSSHDKFKRAAIDLVLEGHLLSVLEHNNIVGLRGWNPKGPQSFASGRPRDYFLMLDKLSSNLQARMGKWRSRLVKLQSKQKRSTTSRTFWRRTTAADATDKHEAKLQALLHERLRAAHGVASALSYLHGKRLIHRDLKSSNIGFDTGGTVKIFDLGLARLLPPDGSKGYMHDNFFMSRVGTKLYMAPEVRRKEPYSVSADVYSFGVVLWEILSLSTPRDVVKLYKELDAKRRTGTTHTPEYKALKHKIQHQNASSWLPLCGCWPAALRSLVETCLAESSPQRPFMRDVCEILRTQLDSLQE